MHVIPSPGSVVDIPAHLVMFCFLSLSPSPWLRSYHFLPGSLMQPPMSVSLWEPCSPMASISLRWKPMFLLFPTRPPTLLSLPAFSPCLLLLLFSLTLRLPSWPPCSRLGSPLTSLHCVFLLPAVTSSSDF